MKIKGRKDGTYKVTVTQDEIDGLYDALSALIPVGKDNLAYLDGSQQRALFDLDDLADIIEPVVTPTVISYVDGVRYTSEQETEWRTAVANDVTVMGFADWLRATEEA